MDSKQSIGAKGEKLVSEYYQSRGYRVLGRNWRCRFGELDLICKKQKMVYVIEVKTRSSRKFGLPEEAITQTKAARMMRCAAVYCAEKGIQLTALRLQVCSLEVARDCIYLKIINF